MSNPKLFNFPKHKKPTLIKTSHYSYLNCLCLLLALLTVLFFQLNIIKRYWYWFRLKQDSENNWWDKQWFFFKSFLVFFNQKSFFLPSTSSLLYILCWVFCCCNELLQKLAKVFVLFSMLTFKPKIKAQTQKQ